MEVKGCGGGGVQAEGITRAKVWKWKKCGTYENVLCSVLFCSDWLKGRVCQNGKA